MPTINLEMMKQLLEEFSEKEALTAEEINVIEKEIASLVQRVDICCNRLQTLGADKEKLTDMKKRYSSGNFSQPAKVTITKTIEETNIHRINPIAVPTLSVLHDQSDIPDIANPMPVPQTQPVQPESPPATESESPAAEFESNAQANIASLTNYLERIHKEEPSEIQQESDINQEDSEPIKNINDALKGLFRQ